MSAHCALVTGATGQDGVVLSEFLLHKGYDVYGICRRHSAGDLNWRLKENTYVAENVHYIDADLTDQTSLNNAVRESKPDEIYNLGANSFVATSWLQPVQMAEVTGLGALRMLEAYRQYAPAARYYQASSSEMFGNSTPPQNELTQLHPRSPYGVAKVFAHNATVNYRESYKLHASCGILFNHEGVYRSSEFVTRRITLSVAKIKKGLQKELTLGNLSAKRDWGDSVDYVKAMWLMLQQDQPDNYVVATGETHSVEEFVSLSFQLANLGDWRDYVKNDAKLMRPAEVDVLCGDASKARIKLSWQPKIGFTDLVKLMVEKDMERLQCT